MCYFSSLEVYFNILNNRQACVTFFLCTSVVSLIVSFIFAASCSQPCPQSTQRYLTVGTSILSYCLQIQFSERESTEVEDDQLYQIHIDNNYTINAMWHLQRLY